MICLAQIHLAPKGGVITCLDQDLSCRYLYDTSVPNVIVYSELN